MIKSSRVLVKIIYFIEVSIFIIFSAVGIALIVAAYTDKEGYAVLWWNSQKWIIFYFIFILFNGFFLWLILARKLRLVLSIELLLILLVLSFLIGRYGFPLIGINKSYPQLSFCDNLNDNFASARYLLRDDLIIPELSKKHKINGNSLNKAEVQLIKLNMRYNVLTSFEHNGNLTSKLILTYFRASLQNTKPIMLIRIDTKAAPAWNCYSINGNISCSNQEIAKAYQEASNFIMYVVRSEFPKEQSGLNDDEIRIDFSLQGKAVGSWINGDFKLAN